MAATDTVHVGDIGTVIVYTVKDGGVQVDLSTATVVLRIVNELKDVVELDGEFETDGTDGVVYFTSDANTWTVPGRTDEQVQFALPGGDTWSCRSIIRNVGKRL